MRVGGAGNDPRPALAPATLGPMLKVMAVLRTVFLIFIVGYTVMRATPFQIGLPVASAAAYDTARHSLSAMTKAAWFAIAWIAFETLVGWWLATRSPKLHERGLPRPGGEPPFAPPPHA